MVYYFGNKESFRFTALSCPPGFLCLLSASLSAQWLENANGYVIITRFQCPHFNVGSCRIHDGGKHPVAGNGQEMVKWLLCVKHYTMSIQNVNAPFDMVPFQSSTYTAFDPSLSDA